MTFKGEYESSDRGNYNLLHLGARQLYSLRVPNKLNMTFRGES